MREFHNKVVIITGGTRGIGLGLVERFVQAGAHVVTCGRHEPESSVATFVKADIRDPEHIDQVIQKTQELYKGIDILINNAGGSPLADTSTASPRFSTAIITLNLITPLIFAQKVNAIMQKQETGGVIINIASVSGMRPSPQTAAYGAAKAGVINLTETLAMEWAPKVRVNAISPGLVETEQAHAYDKDAVVKKIPMQRLAQPEDIAEACLFLASARAQYMNGSNLVMHGGRLI